MIEDGSKGQKKSSASEQVPPPEYTGPVTRSRSRES